MDSTRDAKLSVWHQRCLLGAIVLVALVATLFMSHFWQQSERWMRGIWFSQAQFVARAVPLDSLRAFCEMPRDPASPIYGQLKGQMIAARRLDERWRRLYLMALRPDGSVSHLVDSEPGGGVVPSGGQLGEGLAALLRRVFETGEPAIEGPVVDASGSWMRVLVPIRDVRTGEIPAVFGVDLPAGYWQRELLAAGIPLLVFGSSLFGLLLLGLLLYWHQSVREKRLRLCEVGWILAVGLVLTLAVCWRTARQEHHQRFDRFSRLAAAFSAHTIDAFRDLRDSEIQSLAAYFRAAGRVDGRSFLEFVEPLARNPAVRSWGWATEVPGESRTSFEEAMRAAGHAEFRIWQRGDDGSPTPAAARETYYPVTYSVAPADSFPAFGFDLASEPRRQSALAEARRTGLPAATEPVHLAGSLDPLAGIVVFAHVASSAEVSGELRSGYVLAVVELGGLLRTASESLLSATGKPHAFIELWQLSPDRPPERLATTAGKDARAVWPQRPAHVQPIFSFGKVYALVSRPGPGFLAANPYSLTWVTALFGLVLTLATTLLVGLQGQRHDGVARELALRTAELATERRRLDLLTLHGKAYIWEVDPAGMATYISRNVANVLGYQPEEMVGKMCFYDLHPEEERETFKTECLAVLGRLEPFKDLESRVLDKDGRCLWMVTEGVPVLDRDGRLIGYRGIDRDITEQRRTRERERFQRRFDKLLAEISADFVVVGEEEFERVLEASLVRIGELLAADRCYVLRLAAEGEEMLCNHIWHAPGLFPRTVGPWRISAAACPWLMEQAVRGRTVQIAALEALPEAGGDREYLRGEGVQSILCLPMFEKSGRRIGFLGVDTVRAPREWSEEDVAGLGTLARIMAGAIERNRSERELAASEKTLRLGLDRLDTILAATGMNIDIIDRDCRIHHVDTRWRRFYGDPDGRLCHEYFMGLAEPCERCSARQAISSRNIVVGEQVLAREGGRVVQVYSIPFQEKEGGEWLVAELNIDITDRRRVETDLQEALENYRLLAEYTDDFVAMNTPEGERLYVSPSYYRKTGWTEAEIRSQDWRSRVHPDDLSAVEELHAANQAGESTRGEYRILCKDGSWLWVDSQCKVVLDAEGKVERMVLWSRDITERKRAEAEREKLLGQLRRTQAPAGGILRPVPGEGPPPELPTGRETVLVAGSDAALRELLGRLGYTVLLAETPAQAIRLAGTHPESIHLLLAAGALPGMDVPALAGRVRRCRPGIPCLQVGTGHDGSSDAGCEFLSRPFTDQMLAEAVRNLLDCGKEG